MCRFYHKTLAEHYCLSPKSPMTLLSLSNDTKINKSVWQAMFVSFVKFGYEMKIIIFSYESA